MVEFQPSKLVAWVRFPSLAPICALSSVDRVPGYEPVGRRFESSRARHRKNTPKTGCFFLSCGVLLFGFEPCVSALKVRLSQPKIEELALQAQVVDIFAKGEYPPGRAFKILAKIYLLPQINPSVIFLGKMPPPFTQRRLICGIPSGARPCGVFFAFLWRAPVQIRALRVKLAYKRQAWISSPRANTLRGMLFFRVCVLLRNN